MKYSLRIKLTVILIAIVSCVIFLTWFLNFAFAEQFYEMTEKNNVIQTYHKIDILLKKSSDAEESDDEDADSDVSSDQDSDGSSDQNSDGSVSLDMDEELSDDEAFLKADTGERILDLCNRSNIRVMVAETDSFLLTPSVVYTNMISGTGVYNELLWYLDQIQTGILFSDQFGKSYTGKDFARFSLINVDSDFWNQIEKDGYVVKMMKKRNRGNSGIYLFGYTKSKQLVAMVVPLESIKTSAAISSRFFAYIGLIGIILGSIAILVVSTQFTKPIKDMAGIADKMAQLDFDAKINLNTRDELELLGNSMNTLSETLESTIGDLKCANLELQKDIEKKEQIDEMRKEFLSHVSHELKTPIALIQGYAEGLSENILDDEESKEFYCEVIADEARKMNTMVQKLLTLNQIEFGNNQLELQRFDICQMIHNKIQSSQILIRKSRCQVVFEEKAPVYVWADEFMIEEVFSNYFSNALHHVRPEGMIKVWLERREADVRIHVYNDGKQIPKEDIEKLWIKFYKVDKARTREYGGSGIGLSIVAATMNAHGKAFGVLNEENGVDFYFDLDAEN